MMLGDPLTAYNAGRVPTLSREEGGVKGDWLGLGFKSGLRGDRGASQGFYIHRA